MVLPLKEHPTAPAQGALAVETAAHRENVSEWIGAISHRPTWEAVERERAILQSYGGGCHEAVGATVLVREYGRVVSIRARGDDEPETAEWSLETTTPLPPRAPQGSIWPRPEERDFARRRLLDVPFPADADGLWIARADALHVGEQPREEQVVWGAGSRTWERLAERGVWVNGCADGLGDAELPAVDLLAGRSIRWTKLTHADSGDPDAVATYAVDQDFPEDFAGRTHFFWTSGSAFLKAVAKYPSIRHGWHASGPGRTGRVIRENLGIADHVSVWLDYDQWLHRVTS
jgi:hydroxymethylbilane synthase